MRLTLSLKRLICLLCLAGLAPAPALHADIARLDEIVHAHQRAAIVYAAPFSDAQKRVVHQWLHKAGSALLTVYGELPKDEFQIVVERSRPWSSPVPWGHIERGQPTRVVLVVNPDAGLQRLLADWTVFHELSHLFLPYRGYGNIWLSEGLATYYQNIVQARSGLLNEQQMWQRIAAGLERGRRQDELADLTLTQVSARMRETRQFMRIHWSGVLYWLNADLHLRATGKGTLDLALKRLKNCCEHGSMSAEGLARKLDELMHTRIFLPLFEQYRVSHRLPEYAALLEQLGIERGGGGDAVSLDDAAPLAEIRKGIYHG